LGTFSSAPAKSLDITFRYDTGLGALHGHKFKAGSKDNREKNPTGSCNGHGKVKSFILQEHTKGGNRCILKKKKKSILGVSSDPETGSWKPY